VAGGDGRPPALDSGGMHSPAPAARAHGLPGARALRPPVAAARRPLPALLLAVVAAGCGGSKPPSVPPPACALPTPQPSALPAAQVIELGVQPVGTQRSFTVPPGTGSVTILQQGTEPSAAQTITYQGSTYGNTVVPYRVFANGVEIYNDGVTPPADPAANGGVPVYFWTEAVWTGTLTVPNTSSLLQSGVPSGTWTIEVNDYARECKGTRDCTIGNGADYPPGRYDVKVLLKPGPVPAAGGIDVVFQVLSIDPVLNGPDPLSNPSVKRMRDTLAQLLGNAGLVLGGVSFRPLPASVKDHFATGVGGATVVNADDALPCGDLATLLQSSGPGNAMNVFLVDRFSSTQDGTSGAITVGLDGAVPGPSSVGGTVASGAAVSVANLFSGTIACAGAPSFRACGADKTAYIAAHEIGHFLGLYHDTEAIGTFFDPVADTPTCPCSACRPAGAVDRCYGATGVTVDTAYQMTGTDCTPSTACGGGDNLMFWLVSASSTGTVSTDQARIVRANPLVR